MSAGLACMACGTAIDGPFVALSRVEQIGNMTRWAEGLGAWCLQCGSEGSSAALRALGVEARPAEADPPDAPCDRCHSVVVSQTEWHTGFRVEQQRWVGDDEIEISAAYRYASVCSGCFPSKGDAA